jgi:hypothetical protein
MIFLSQLLPTGKTAAVNVVVECFMIANTVIAPDVTSKTRGKRMTKESAADGAEDKLLATLAIKCKECDARMSWGRQEGKRYYMCTNNAKHEDGLDRMVWVDMPTYLDFN